MHANITICVVCRNKQTNKQLWIIRIYINLLKKNRYFNERNIIIFVVVVVAVQMKKKNRKRGGEGEASYACNYKYVYGNNNNHLKITSTHKN